jgi:hypothetical protein
MSDVKRISAGPVTLTSFENQVKGQGGKKDFTSTSVTLQKSYKDKEGKWANTGSFKPGELLQVLVVIQKFLADYYLRAENKAEDVSMPDDIQF